MKLSNFAKPGRIGFFICVTLLCSVRSFAQLVFPIPANLSGDEKKWQVNGILDTVVHASLMNKAGIICINKDAITVDTLTLSRVQRVKNDSVVLGKFLKKNQKKISSKEFWGLNTNNGEKQRFYEGKMYLVWESPSPYIYKTEEMTRTHYYFSETLLSPIYSLNPDTINNTTLSPDAKNILFDFIKETVLEEKARRAQTREQIAGVSLDILSVLFQILLVVDDYGLYHSSQQHHDHPKKSTGRRK
jgi:hypothetical protein